MSAIWVEASLGALLPPGTTDIISTIQTVIGTVTPLLDTVNSALDAASTFLQSWPVFDFAKALGDLIAQWKSDFLMQGLYMLPLWDYPVKQLAAKQSYGPEQTFGLLNFNGTTFQDFTDDIARSMTARKDPNRPRFNFDCAMLVLVMAWPDITACTITAEEGGTNRTFPGLKDLTGAAYGIRELRWQGAWRKLRDATALSPVDQVEARTLAVIEAHELFSTFDRQELDAIPYPGTDDDPFLEKVSAGSITWDTIQGAIDAVTFAYEGLEYPSWTRVNMTDLIPGLQDMVNQIFDPVIAVLRSAKNVQQVILDLIESIKKRVEALQALVAQIDYILEQLDALINATGFYAVFINSVNGTPDLMSQLQASVHPFVDAEGRPTRQFFAGMALVAGGPALAPFRLLMAPVAGV